jgi:hypothetical protein
MSAGKSDAHLFSRVIINFFDKKSNNLQDILWKFVENNKPIWAKGKEKGCEREK